MDELMLRIDNVSKQYRLGQIGGTTLRDELQRLGAKIRGKEDPTKSVGSKNYNKGEKFMALDGVSFDVKKGERIGLIGHNGAGKSTLLKLISRVTAPTGGTIGLNGRITSMLEVGTGFHQELTGRENIYMNGAILGMTKKEIDAKMEDIIEFSEVRQFIDTPVKRYSSGMYVKLAFSVAANLDSEIMIMDEVLAVGDMAFQKKCLDKMNLVSKTEGRSILYVSHNMNTIRQLCDRCIVLDKGTVIYDGDVEEAISKYLGISREKKMMYNFFEEQHQTSTDAEIRINSFSYIKTDSPVFGQGDFLHGIISCESFRDNNLINFRLEVKYKDGTIAGTALISKAIMLKKGKNDVYISWNTQGIAPGLYSADIIAYIYNSFGTEVLIDAVYPGFYFEIEEKLTPKTPIIWLHNYWGHVQLSDIDAGLDDF